METVLVNVKKKSDLAFLLNLVEKLGMTAKTLSSAEIEDWKFAQKIETGMKTATVSRKEIMKSLGR